VAAEGQLTVMLLPGAEPGDGLVSALGAERCAALRELQRARARAWAGAAFDAAGLREVDGDLDDAVTAELADAEGDGRVVFVVPELAVWRPDVGREVLEDLEAGCAMSFGPVFDGGLYLLAVGPAAWKPLRSTPQLDLGGRAAMAGLVELAATLGFEVGMLRSERGVARAEDVSALLVDPLTDVELRGVLG
jgi:hypothetical protein